MRSTDELPIRLAPSAYDPTRTWPAALVLSCRIEQAIHHRGARQQDLSMLGIPAFSIFL